MRFPTSPFWRAVIFIGCIAFVFSAAFIGSVATIPEISTWYASLEKPWFNPPNWVFGPVWTVLYFLQGWALYLVLRSEKPHKKFAVSLFIVQLVCNVAWSLVFFAGHYIAWSLVVIGLLLALLVLTIRAFSNFSVLASRLLWPYVAWVSFATLLNIGILLTNNG